MKDETYIIRVLSFTREVLVVVHKDAQRQDLRQLLSDARWVGRSWRRAYFQKWLYNLLDRL